MPGDQKSYMPVEPLQAVVEQAGGFGALMDRAGLTGQERHRTNQRWLTAMKRGRFSITNADAICLDLLGMHPANVYGERWWE